MILIDGYNLLHVTGLSGPEINRTVISAGALERARNALLNFLAVCLDESERQQTTVAFDSSNAPAGLPRELQHRGITVKFATGYESADELLEELIREAAVPRRMTVVSSDHRVQRAAKRRRARAVDSDVWYAEIREPRGSTEQPRPASVSKPTLPLSEAEVAAWLEEFGDVRLDEPVEPTRLADEAGRAVDGSTADRAASNSIENPFPPGYAEDLLDPE